MFDKEKIQYLVIPIDLLNDKRLTPFDGYVYALVFYLSHNKNGCTASNKTIAKMFECHYITVSAAISKLVKLGYLKSVNHYREGTKSIAYRELTPISLETYTYKHNDLDGISESPDTPISLETEDKKNIYKNKSIKLDSSIESVTYIEVGGTAQGDNTHTPALSDTECESNHEYYDITENDIKF